MGCGLLAKHAVSAPNKLCDVVPEPVNEVALLVTGDEFLDQLKKFQFFRKELLVYY